MIRHVGVNTNTEKDTLNIKYYPVSLCHLKLNLRIYQQNNNIISLEDIVFFHFLYIFFEAGDHDSQNTLYRQTNLISFFSQSFFYHPLSQARYLGYSMLTFAYFAYYI